MRLWSVHPRYFDRQALTACWREGLLAQAVIVKTSGGYSNHPQLVRFRACPEPLESLRAYLHCVADEADARGYTFARHKVFERTEVPPIPLTEGQLAYEWQHLLAKLAVRTPELAERFAGVPAQPHPLFTVVPGPIESWERPSG